ncbi:unnamed protein product [Caenorhabditis auriculariae]|uniref:Uncharacterized protein n=1 Tax=Caenorhabditis auriculariae TaxID=2777116 RepID=A0A8S1GQ49_9PELO|nr:unnamed protein product [Caenorhabditis auriculariae]
MQTVCRLHEASLDLAPSIVLIRWLLLLTTFWADFKCFLVKNHLQHTSSLQTQRLKTPTKLLPIRKSRQRRGCWLTRCLWWTQPTQQTRERKRESRRVLSDKYKKKKPPPAEGVKCEDTTKRGARDERPAGGAHTQKAHIKEEPEARKPPRTLPYPHLNSLEKRREGKFLRLSAFCTL